MQHRIKQLMESQHMNQQTFAAFTGISPATLSGIFQGRTNPTINTVTSIKNKFPTLNTNWLMFGTGDMFDNGGGAADSHAPVTTPEVSASANTTSHEGQAGMASTASPAGIQPTLFNDTAKLAEQSTPQVSQRPNSHRGHADSSMTQAPRRAHVEATSVQQAPASSREYVIQQSPVSRKITEIRVFYDDQTWESFVPKNN